MRQTSAKKTHPDADLFLPLQGHCCPCLVPYRWCLTGMQWRSGHIGQWCCCNWCSGAADGSAPNHLAWTSQYIHRPWWVKHTPSNSPMSCTHNRAEHWYWVNWCYRWGWTADGARYTLCGLATVWDEVSFIFVFIPLHGDFSVFKVDFHCFINPIVVLCCINFKVDVWHTLTIFQPISEHKPTISILSDDKGATSSSFSHGNCAEIQVVAVIITRAGSYHMHTDCVWMNSLTLLADVALTIIGSALLTWVMQSGQVNDLKNTISLHWQALNLWPAPHPDRYKSLMNLALALLTWSTP